MSDQISIFNQTNREVVADGVLSIRGAVAFAGGTVGRTTLYQAIADGELPSVKVGRRRGIPKAGFVDWLATHVERPVNGQD